MSQIEGESSLQHQHAKCLGWICHRGLQLCWVSVLLIPPSSPSPFPALLPLLFFSCSTQQFLQAADLLISMENFRLWEELDHRDPKGRPEFTPRLTHLQPNSLFFFVLYFYCLRRQSRAMIMYDGGVSFTFSKYNVLPVQIFLCCTVSPELLLWSVFSLFALSHYVNFALFF